jgi:hypothetical protein
MNNFIDTADTSTFLSQFFAKLQNVNRQHVMTAARLSIDRRDQAHLAGIRFHPLVSADDQ